jgi:hypothetical protein
MGRLMIRPTILGLLVSDHTYRFDIWLTEKVYTVLDPRIGYEGLLADCGDDASMRRSLDHSREALRDHYRTHYAPSQSTNSDVDPMPSVPSGSPQKVDFTARYKKRTRAFIDEIEEFFKLPSETFDNCDPIQWWAGRRAQFPNLSRLARDILAIPGVNTIQTAVCAISC